VFNHFLNYAKRGEETFNVKGKNTASDRTGKTDGKGKKFSKEDPRRAGEGNRVLG